MPQSARLDQLHRFMDLDSIPLDEDLLRRHVESIRGDTQ